MWKNYKNRLWWFFVGLCFGLIPYILNFANLQRGYNATGGEMLIIIIPIIVWLLKETCKGVMQHYKSI